MVALNFDATKVEPNTGGTDVFETGDYAFQIVKSEPKQTKKGDGTMLIFEASCLEEGFAGKRLQIRLNIANPNQTAVEIAYRDLSAICHVCGVLQIQDTQQLHGRPFRIRLEKVARSDDPSKFGNEVRAYMDMQGNAPGAAPAGGGAPAAPAAPAAPPAAPAPAAPAVPPAAAPAAAAPAAAGAAPPWAQGAAAPAAAAGAAVPPWQQG